MDKPLITITISGNTIGEVTEKIVALYSDFVFRDSTVKSDDSQQLKLTEVAPVVPETVEEALTVTEDKSAVKKRGRKPRAVVEPVETPAVEPKETVEDVKQPAFFYSLTEFQQSFAIILNELLVSGRITPEVVNEYCKKYEVQYIYQLTSKHDQLADMFNDLVVKSIVVKKADY